MQLLFLGTGAGDFLAGEDPANQDEHVFRARELGGRNLRFASQTLVDSDILIDFYSDRQISLLDVDASRIKHLLITHCHWDHFQPERILAFATGRPHPLQIYGNETAEVGLEFAASNRWDPDRKRFTARSDDAHYAFREIRPGETVNVADVRVTAVLANHHVDFERRIVEQRALNYVIERNGKTVFYGLDSSYVFPGTLEVLKEFRLDAAVFDSTFGHHDIDPGASGHHNFRMLGETIGEFRECGIISDETAVYGSHISLGFVPPHDDIVDEAAQLGIILAFDGMCVEV